MSILSHIEQNSEEKPRSIRLLYSSRVDPNMDVTQILFFSRLLDIFYRANRSEHYNWILELFITTNPPLNEASGLIYIGDVVKQKSSPADLRMHERRISKKDLLGALGPLEQREKTVAYVCGPPQMTDAMVNDLATAEGMDKTRVLSEKWW